MMVYVPSAEENVVKPCTSGGLAFLLLSLPLISCSTTNGPATATLTIRGTVNEADIGMPIGGALVQIQIVTSSGPGAWASDSTGADGSYIVKVEAPGGCEGRDSVDAVVHAEAMGFDSLQEGAAAGDLKVACQVEPQTLDVTLELPLSRTPVAVAGNLTAMDVSSGKQSACATTDAGAFCWGVNSENQLTAVGSPDDGTGVLKVPTPVVNGSGLVQVDATYRVACGLDADGAAYCWGDNGWDQLGISDSTVWWADEAMPVKTDLRFTQITASAYAPCGLTAQGTVYCWGSGLAVGIGVIGDDVPTPEPIASGRTFVQVSAGHGNACALDDTGAAWCWGRNTHGEVGSGVAGSGDYGSFVASPTQVVGGHQFVQIAAGGNDVCALTASGEAWCWGRNDAGQLGNGQDMANSAEPLAVAGEHTFTSLSTGYDHTCGLTSDGAAYCWGWDYTGDLGFETTETCERKPGEWVKCARTPEPVSGGLKFSKLGAGWGITCGMTSTGKLYCWGLKEALGTG